MTSNGLIAHVPANPAWVGAGRRTSMFGTTRTASVQQNHRGTVLTTPSSKIFNEKWGGGNRVIIKLVHTRITIGYIIKYHEVQRRRTEQNRIWNWIYITF